jgi:hypothetical protein
MGQRRRSAQRFEIDIGIGSHPHVTDEVGNPLQIFTFVWVERFSGLLAHGGDGEVTEDPGRQRLDGVEVLQHEEHLEEEGAASGVVEVHEKGRVRVQFQRTTCGT